MTNPNMPDILTQIIAHKRLEVAQRQQQVPLDMLLATISSQSYNQLANKSYDFGAALQHCIVQQRPAIIAEIKKASPSKGLIRRDFENNFDPEYLALEYVVGGAACISVLTDMHFFQGSNDNLSKVRNCCQLPLLRKEFIIDSYQVYEAKALGADCILLIVAALNDPQLHELHDLAITLHLQVLVESHDRTELQRALTLATPLIGINNRDLRTFNTSLHTTLQLRDIVPPDRLIITESGIVNSTDIKLMQQHGIHCFLIGETLLQHPHPALKLQELLAA